MKASMKRVFKQVKLKVQRKGAGSKGSGEETTTKSEKLPSTSSNASSKPISTTVQFLEDNNKQQHEEVAPSQNSDIQSSGGATQLKQSSSRGNTDNPQDTRLAHRENAGEAASGDKKYTSKKSNPMTSSEKADALLGKGGGSGEQNRNTTAASNPSSNEAKFEVEHIATTGPGYDSPQVAESYSKTPLLEQTILPRGGVSMETKAVGRVQFGIPPETIKDSMQLGIPVPQVYIVPVERFCREMGPALGVNLAEFEFPAYFNFFVYKKRCTLVVDSPDAEDNIRRVFSETLLGPAQFRREENPITYEEEDFAPGFNRDAIPNFQKEFKHFRIMPDGKELELATLLDFCHFEYPQEVDGHDNLGVPPPLEGESGAASIPDESENAGLDNDVPMDALSDTADEGEAVPQSLEGVEQREKSHNWTYAQARWVDVATLWPSTATEEQKKNRSVPRVEIFKMPGGTEYILHDIDENNRIIGKARFSGHVKVKESISVIGFGDGDASEKPESSKSERKKKGKKGKRDKNSSTNSVELEKLISKVPSAFPPSTFHPPSFGVTVLGNSHGFDKSGSVSGYVLWVNGRGVMIDPPPYSSATLEREGIRPRMIVGIILTHCHADHDAGAFQKVLTGSPVVVITTPTIYKSFIRKYAALSALSPALLRHSHRYKPAIIGQPLRFQGATFHFIYTLHTIPCVGFRVEWRGRSMVFTGDHFNSPVAIDKLQYHGVLSKARADDLRNLPLQETDLLLHEAGAPPIHTPLDVLMKLPENVKRRLFVVHTSALPEGCDLRVAPTGTEGTIRLDRLQHPKKMIEHGTEKMTRDNDLQVSDIISDSSDELLDWTSANREYDRDLRTGDSAEFTNADDHRLMMATSFANLSYDPSANANSKKPHHSMHSSQSTSVLQIPLVSLRPASSTDAWFILNLLSAVPFLSSLSYTSTMEVLETARVDAYCQHEIVVPSKLRSQYLCVVWEGTCSERKKVSKSHSMTHKNSSLTPIDENFLESGEEGGAVWFAGDWTGPIALQPERRLSSECDLSSSHDVVAVSKEGVKVITIDFSNLDIILKNGSSLYKKYLERISQNALANNASSQNDEQQSATEQLLGEAMRNLNILELLNDNSALRKLSAVQKRHLECLAEGPVSFLPGERIWRAGAPVDKAFIIVSGTASFVPRRRNAGSAVINLRASQSRSEGMEGENLKGHTDSAIGNEMAFNAAKACRELGSNNAELENAAEFESKKKSPAIQFDHLFTGGGGNSGEENNDFAKLSRGLQKRADMMLEAERCEAERSERSLVSGSVDSSLNSSGQAEGDESDIDFSFGENESHNFDDFSKDRRSFMKRRRSSKARFQNKVLGRLYSRRAFTGGLIFSRGHFLGDVSKMVAGLLASDVSSELNDDSLPSYGFGDTSESGGKGRRVKDDDGVTVNLTELVIHEREGDDHIMHSSTLTAGKDGCVVLIFNKASLIPFLDEYPGLLLSLLGTQVVV